MNNRTNSKIKLATDNFQIYLNGRQSQYYIKTLAYGQMWSKMKPISRDIMLKILIKEFQKYEDFDDSILQTRIKPKQKSFLINELFEKLNYYQDMKKLNNEFEKQESKDLNNANKVSELQLINMSKEELMDYIRTNIVK